MILSVVYTGLNLFGARGCLGMFYWLDSGFLQVSYKKSVKACPRKGEARLYSLDDSLEANATYMFLGKYCHIVNQALGM